MKKEFDPYKIDRLSRIPLIVKVIVIKFWMAGAVCFFMIMGTFNVYDYLDGIVFVGTILGIITDYLMNGMIRWCNSQETPSLHYQTIYLKPSVKRLLLNILYGMAMMALIMFTYENINLLLNSIFKYEKDNVQIGVEPIGFGLLYVAYDMLILKIRDLFRRKKNEI